VLTIGPDRGQGEAEARRWWVPLVSGILLLVLGFVVLSYSAQSLVVLSIFIGVSFVLTGFSWLALATVVDELRWFWIVGGILALCAGTVAFVYPGETLRVLALVIGWFLLVAGILDIVNSLLHRHVEGWWLGLAQGIVMLGLGAWAAGEDDRSVILLVTIVGVFCLLRGINDIVVAFRLKGPGAGPPLAPA
jgi:uncharacterized membrane protein HdeD (DUF308 family)